jgi:hypothetical protein
MLEIFVKTSYLSIPNSNISTDEVRLDRLHCNYSKRKGKVNLENKQFLNKVITWIVYLDFAEKKMFVSNK